MSARAFQIVWSWVALLVLLLSVLGYLRITGLEAGGAGTVLEAFGFLSSKPAEVATFVLPLQIVLMALLLRLTTIWTREMAGKNWPTRLPVFFFKPSEIDPNQPGGQWYQRIALVILLWLPLLITILFMASYLGATIYFSPKGTATTYSTGISGLGHFDTERIRASAHGAPGFWRLGDDSGPQYYPILVWIYAIALLGLITYFYRVVISGVIRRHNLGTPRLILVPTNSVHTTAAVAPASASSRMVKTLHALIEELERRSPRIAAMALKVKIPDGKLKSELFNLANEPADLDRAARAVEALRTRAKVGQAEAESMVRLLITEKHLYGTYCELGAYDWFDRSGVAFTAQVSLTAQEVLNPNGCVIDGRFDAIDGYFDIKGFGFQARGREKFREYLQSQLSGLDVVIDGPSDVAVKDIETYAFGRIRALRQSLAKGGIERIKELGWTVRAQPPRRITMSVQEQNPYRLAMENRYYPFKTASQFARLKPFLLVFSYAARFNTSLATNFASSADIALRSLARRAFFELSADVSAARAHDQQTPPNTTIGDASKLISGLLFLNLDSDSGALFINPRATHPLTPYLVQEVFDFQLPFHLQVDDFAYDNY